MALAPSAVPEVTVPTFESLRLVEANVDYWLPFGAY
jgi:hypothetical protein